MKRNRTEGVQPGLFEGPPAGPVAKPAPRPGVSEASPPAPTLRFSGVYREWHSHYGHNIQHVDILAGEDGHTREAGLFAAAFAQARPVTDPPRAKESAG